MDGTLLEEHGITGLELSSFKHKFGYGGNNNSIQSIRLRHGGNDNVIRSIQLRNWLQTPTTSDNELWCNYFQHCSQYVEDYSLSSSKTPWDEINWPSRSNDECNKKYYTSRVSGTNGRGFDVDDERILHPMNQHQIQGNKVQQPRHISYRCYTPGSTNGINCSNDNNRESLSHVPPYKPPPVWLWVRT